MKQTHMYWRIGGMICGVAVLGLCIIGTMRLQQWQANWELQMKDLYAHSDAVEFGDGSHLIPITPTLALPIGVFQQHDIVGIMVTRAEAPRDMSGLEQIPQTSMYWEVEFTIENTSASQPARIHPLVDSQIQDMTPQREMYDFGFATRDPNVLHGVITLAPKTTLHGTLTYRVPRTAAALYWVYADVWEKDPVVIKVR